MKEYLTDAGRDMLAGMLAGENTIKYTKVQMGDGTLSTSQHYKKMTALVNVVATLDVDSVVVTSDNIVKVAAVFTNKELTSGFYYREKGIFATDGKKEVLFAYANSGSEAEWIEPPTVELVEKKIVSLYKEYQDTETELKIEVASGIYTTTDDFKEKTDEISEEFEKIEKSYDPITKNLCNALDGMPELSTTSQIISVLLEPGEYMLAFRKDNTISAQYTIESVDYDLTPNGALSSGGGLKEFVNGLNTRQFSISSSTYITAKSTKEIQVWDMQIEAGDTYTGYEEHAQSLRTLTTDITLLQNENKATSDKLAETNSNIEGMSATLSNKIEGLQMIYDAGKTEYEIDSAGSSDNNTEINSNNFVLKCIDGNRSGEVRFTKPIDFRNASRLLYNVITYNNGTANIMRIYIGTTAGANDLASFDIPLQKGINGFNLPDAVKINSGAYLTFIVGVSAGNTARMCFYKVYTDNQYQDYFNKTSKMEDFYFMKYYSYLQNNIGKLFAKSTTANDKIESNGRSFTRTVNDPALLVKFKYESGSGSYSDGYAILSTTKRGCSVGTPGNAYGALANDIYTEMTPNGNTVYVAYMGSSWLNIDRTCIATTGGISTTITDAVYYRNGSSTKNKDKYNKFILTVADFLLFDGQDDLNMSDKRIAALEERVTKLEKLISE